MCALLKSAQALVSAGIFSPELLWQEYWKLQVCRSVCGSGLPLVYMTVVKLLTVKPEVT